MDVLLLDDSSLLEASSATGTDVFMNDSESRLENKSLGPMVPVKVRTMRDYEQQLHELRKQNFHLRLRLFYTQQAKGGQGSTSNGAEFKTFQQQVSHDMETLVSEVDRRNATIQKNWATIQQQHEAIQELSEEKLAIEKELLTLKTKTSLAEAAHKNSSKMADVISELQKRNEQLEQGTKALRQRLSELEEHEVPDLRNQVEKRNLAIQSLTTQVRLQEKTVRSLESQVSLLSSAQPLTDTFLERLDKSLAKSDVDSAVAARDKFKADFTASMQIASRKKSALDDSTSCGSVSALKEQVSRLEAEVQAKEATIEELNREVSQLKSSMRSSKDHCRDLEGEMKRSAQVHMRICTEKDKLLESLQSRLQELEESVQEAQTVKSRHSALERERNSLHAALREKANFIEELLAERNKAVFETEKSFQELIHSMRQKDERIKELQANLEHGKVQCSATNSRGWCSFLQHESLRPETGEEIRESKSFDLIELSVAEHGSSLAENNDDRSKGVDSELSPKCLLNDRGVIEELSELYAVLCKVCQDTEGLSHPRERTPPVAECQSELKLDFVKELKSSLKQVHEKGYRLVLGPVDPVCVDSGAMFSSRAGSENKGRETEKCDGNQVEPILSEKLSEIRAVLTADATVESSAGWRLEDLVSHLDLFLLKVKGNDSELSMAKEKETALVKENKTLREHLLTLAGAVAKLRSSEREMRTELSDFTDGILSDLGPVMECVGFLRDEVETLSLSAKERPCIKNCSSSIDELVYAVDNSGRLVQFTGSMAPSPEPGVFTGSVGTKDATQQTEANPDSDCVEQLKNELNRSRAQVKFLQKSLKDSFSVKMSNSSQPLIEIDQNRPAPEGSPSKSANRRWRKQLTNQKMSEFGLSENVFELQEEIFFLVLRIEDLERQLGRGTSATAHDRSEKSLAALLLEPRAKALQSRNEALEQQVQEMQEVSAVLLCRLEELATFLEQLLVSDGSGALGSVSLPPDTIARMRQLVDDSRDFSLSVSQSILGSDTGSMLSERSALKASVHKERPSVPSSGRPKSTSAARTESVKIIDPKDIPPQVEDIVFLEEEVSRLRQQVEEQRAVIDNLTQHLSKDPSGVPVPSGDLHSSGRNKRSSQSARSQLQKFEKLLRRMQGCSVKLEDALTTHKELCVAMLDAVNPCTAKEAAEQAHVPPSGLIDTHIQAMRKLQFKLEEMVINGEVLREILTERVETGNVSKTEALSTSTSSPEAKTAQKLQQCCKELECKERREEILRRAIAHEQASKVQVEKELLDCQKELHALREAHSRLEENFKQYGTMPNTGFDTQLQATLREVQDWNLRLQKENEDSARRTCELELALEKLRAQYIELGSNLRDQQLELDRATCEVDRLRSLPSPDEVEQLKSELKDRVRELNETNHAIERLSREVTQLQSDKVALMQKLEATHKEHEILLESSSNKISELVTKLGPLSMQNKNQIEEIRALKEANAGLQAELDAAVLKLDVLHQELEALDFLQKENRDLRDSVHTSKNQEISLRDKLQCIIQEFQLLRKTSEEYCRTELVLREENESLSTKVLKLTTQVEELEADAEELRRELEQSEKEHRTAQEQEWKALEQGRETEQMAEEMQRELEVTRAQLEEMENRCSRLERELSSSNETQQQLASANRDLQRLLESKTEQLRAMETSNRELQQTLLQQRNGQGLEWRQTMALQELEDQKRRLQSEVLELQSEVDRVHQHDRCATAEHEVHDCNHPKNSPAARGSPHASIHIPDFLPGQRGSKSPLRPSSELSEHLRGNTSSFQDPNHSRSHHTSPDLGIDSDPTPEREDADHLEAVAGGFEEHWQHRMRGNWSITSVQSAPEAVGGACPLCMQKGASDATSKNKLNWTFAGEAVDYPLGDCSPSKSVFPGMCPAVSTGSVRMCAVVQLVDHELLKKRVDESICLVRRQEGTLQQLLDVLLQPPPEFDEAPDSKKLLQDAVSGCHSIKVCLVESFKLICSFTISPVPDSKDECRQRCCHENKQLKYELSSLQEKHAQQSTELQSALEQISTFKEKKEGMERAISRQLSKTKMVLKQTKGNLNVLRSRNPKADKK